MNRENGSPTPLSRWISVLSIAAILIGILLILLSRQFTDLFQRDLLFGLGLALAPSGILGILADWLVFGRLIEALNINIDQLGFRTQSLQFEIGSLRVSTDFLKQSSELGLEMIYPDRATALKDFAPRMHNEAQRQSRDSKGNLIIVGSSIRGLLENVKDAPSIVKEAIDNECDLRILVTHPKYSRYRENQEDRPAKAIEDEIFDGLRHLESCVEIGYPERPDLKLSPMIKLYKGTPTCFMIVAGNRMLINPYPYEEEAYKSFCIAVRRVEPRYPSIDIERTIYAQYMRAHFEKPWERNSVPYRHYWLEGPNPNQAWDRHSCYGDVFVIQDASHFYIAVYLQGQRKADVRGMPASIPYTDPDQKPEYLMLQKTFSVRLFDAHARIWRYLDDELGLLTLDQDRRRGKVSDEVEGNLLNDYVMLGLFDPEDKVINPHPHADWASDGLKGQPLPLFYVWLQKPAAQTNPTTLPNGSDIKDLAKVKPTSV